MQKTHPKGKKQISKFNHQCNTTKQKTPLLSLRLKNKSFLMIATVFCLPVLLYLQTITFEFTHFDDNILITDNITFLSNFKNAFHAFFTNAFIVKPSLFYRPLQTVSYMIDIQLSGGDNPWMYHLTNVLLLGLIACLLFLLLRALFLPPMLSLASTLLFCVHPLFTSSIAWIPARGELLLTFLVLASFLSLIKYFHGKKTIYLLLHLLAFALALFCKETAAVIPILFVICYFSLQSDKSHNKIYIINIMFYGIFGLLWFWMRAVSISDYSLRGKYALLQILVSNIRVIPESISKLASSAKSVGTFRLG
jgi:hypothetical protein